MSQEKKGIAAWLELPESARLALLGILRTERPQDSTVDQTAADALEELAELRAQFVCLDDISTQGAAAGGIKNRERFADDLPRWHTAWEKMKMLLGVTSK